jgi:hypothetical protein
MAGRSKGNKKRQPPAVDNPTVPGAPRQPVPEGATQKAFDRTSRLGGPPATPAGDRHAQGTPAGGTEVGGLGGTNIDEGSPQNADLEEVMSGDVEEEAEDEGAYGGFSGGAVGGTPAGRRTSGGRTHRGLRPGGVHRGDSTIGSDPTRPTE